LVAQAAGALMAKVPPAGRAMVRFIARTLRGVKASPYPGFIEPCKPTLKPKPPLGDKWQYEIKFDGYRTQIHLRGGEATVFTSSGLDWTDKFASIADAAKQVPANHAVIDGEIIVQNEKGIPDFDALRAAIGGLSERAGATGNTQRQRAPDKNRRKLSLSPRNAKPRRLTPTLALPVPGKTAQGGTFELIWAQVVWFVPLWSGSRRTGGEAAATP
jgi:hypothetical protein